MSAITKVKNHLLLHFLCQLSNVIVYKQHKFYMLVLKMGYRSHVTRFEISGLNLYKFRKKERNEFLISAI
jgi:hypothetical protein